MSLYDQPLYSFTSVSLAIAIVAISFMDRVVFRFPGQSKCMYRQTCCKSGLSSHTRKALPPLCGIMATEKSLQKLIVQVHCQLQLYAVPRLPFCAIRLVHFAFTSRNSHSSLWHLKFVIFTWHSKTLHHSLHIALHSSHFTHRASLIAFHTSLFTYRTSHMALVSHFTFAARNLHCFPRRSHDLHFSRWRDKHELRDTRAKCKIRTRNAKRNCQDENELFFSSLFRESASNEVPSHAGY